jgi:flagellar biosynthesis chaperone FliJ
MWIFWICIIQVLDSSKPADKLKELEDKILEMQNCTTELRVELYSECMKVKENIQAKIVPLGHNKRKYLNSWKGIFPKGILA